MRIWTVTGHPARTAHLHLELLLGHLGPVPRPGQVGEATGKVTAFHDGKVHHGSPADISVCDHVQPKLDVGRPLVAPETTSFRSGL